MKSINIVGALFIMIFWSCAQFASKKDNLNTQQVKFKSGLKIENKTNRGTNYTDLQGTDYNLRYIPITITNTNSVPIRLQFDFPEEEDSPKESTNHLFKILILPEVFALDGIPITTKNQVLIESMQIELRNYLKKGLSVPYQLDKILQPHENILLAIGTHYRPNQSVPTPIPNELFIQNDISNYKKCDNMKGQENVSESQITLWLKLNYNQGRINESCIIFPCGQISYPENL